MTAADNLKLLDDWVAAYNAHDLDRLLSFFADDAIAVNEGLATVRGTAEIRAGYEGSMQGFPDNRTVIVDAIADEDRVFAVCEWSATLTGQLQRPGQEPVAPTGRSAKGLGGWRWRIRDGKIAEMLQVVNYLDIHRQLGLLG